MLAELEKDLFGEIRKELEIDIAGDLEMDMPGVPDDSPVVVKDVATGST